MEDHLSLDTISKIADGLREDGKVVAFTHGAFDLFHFGHLYLLEKTAAHSDFLIIGLESDRNISTYKGVTRPIINEDDRLRIVQSLKCVGAAFINRDPVEDEFYHQLYEQIHPHYVSIGPSFAFREKVERRTSSLGIGLETFGTKHFSTTRIIDRILRRYRNTESRHISPRQEIILDDDKDGA